MIPVALGLVALAVLLWAARGFARARLPNAKALLGWVSALAGLALGAGLLLTGRWLTALLAGVLFGPLAWSWWQESRLSFPRLPSPRPGRMSRTEALAVLGLHDPASDVDVRAAWLRLMRTANPDTGGSDWLAAHVTQARDTLLEES